MSRLLSYCSIVFLLQAAVSSSSFAFGDRAQKQNEVVDTPIEISDNEDLESVSLEVFSTSIDKGMVALRYEGSSDADVSESINRIKPSLGSVSISVPIASNLSLTKDLKFSAWRILANAKVSRLRPNLDVLGDRDIYQIFVGGSAVYMLKKHLFLLYAGLSVAEDSDLLESPELHPLTMLLGASKLSEKSSLLYGAAFTYLYGRGLMLPMGGLVYSPAKTWSTTWLLPFYANIRYKPNNKFAFAMVVKISGGRYRLQNNALFPGESADLYLRLREARLGLQSEWKLSPTWRLQAEIGTSTGRKLIFSTSEDDLSNQEVSAAGYANLGLIYSFGDTVKNTKTPLQNLR